MSDIGWAVQQLKAGRQVRRVLWEAARIASVPELGGAVVFASDEGFEDFGPDWSDHTNLFADDWGACAMTDPRIEQVARRLCKANGIDPDAPMLVPDNDRGGEEQPMWRAYLRQAVEHIAAFDYLALELLGPP